MIETVPAVAPPSVAGDRPVVGSYDTYEQAREAVAFLAGNDVAAHRVGIVGENLRLKDNVLGRMTAPRAAGVGAALGAWFGLPSSLPVLLAAGPWAALLAGVVFGALLGAVFGLTAYWTARGRGDLPAGRSLVAARYDVVADVAARYDVVADVAARYDVVADVAVADDARNLLIEYGRRTG